MRDVKAAVTRLEVGLADVRQMTARIETMFTATIPHLATRADVAEKPGKVYMWGILTVLLTAYASGLAALAILK